MDMIKKADTILGVSESISRVSTVLGAAPATATPPSSAALATSSSPSASMKNFLQRVGATAPHTVKDGAGTLVGAVAGMYLGNKKKHKWLGLIGGASLGRNVPALLRNDDRPFAIKNLLMTGGATAGSLYWKKHPVLGFLVGLAATGTVAYWNEK